MNGMSYFNSAIEQHLLKIRTGYIGRVLSIEGSEARIQPLSSYQATGGSAEESKPASALIPQDIKYKEKTITYMKSLVDTETETILIPDKLAVGDVVFVGISDRDITYAKKGLSKTATNRHHDINDGVILKYLGRW